MRTRALFTAVLSLTLLAATAQAEPISYKELIPLISSVSLPGWTAGTPTGQTVKAPVEASEATLEFANGDKHLELAIFDGGPAMGAAAAAMAQVEMESPDEIIKPVTVKGFKGSLYLHPKDNEADLVILVPPRFAVSIHVNGSADGDLLQKAAAQMDLAKLSTLGK